MLKILKLIIDAYRYSSYIGFFSLLKYYFGGNAKDSLVELKLKQICFKFYVRQNTSDMSLIKSIFFHKEYPIFNNFEPEIIIDAGANIGLASIYFKNNYPNAKIIAIEPEDSNFELLKKNTEPYANIFLIKGALLHDDGLDVQIANKNAEKYSYRIDIDSNNLGTNSDESKSYSINNLVRLFDINKIDLLKIDVEGSEKYILSHNLEWLKITDHIFIELHDHYVEGCSKALISAIIDYDFIIRIRGENLILSKKLLDFI